jgi:hypothetical protein
MSKILPKYIQNPATLFLPHSCKNITPQWMNEGVDEECGRTYRGKGTWDKKIFIVPMVQCQISMKREFMGCEL